MSCASGCYEATVENCNDIIIRAAFPSNYPLYWLIQKGSGNIHQRLVETDDNGDLTIEKSNLPNGYLIKGAYYKIKIRNGANYLQSVNFTFGDDQYSCIMAQIATFNRDEEDDSEVNVIQFTAAETSGSSGDSEYLIPVTAEQFTDATHYDDADIIGHDLAIFWNNANRYLLPTEWTTTLGGINITAEGFNAVDNPDTYILIYIIN
jgi:hypothetical protein